MSSFCLFLLLLLFCAINAKISDIILDTQLGQIRGRHDEIEGVYSFLGIPYGPDMSASNRFRPSSVNDAPWNGIFDGRTFGDVCMMLDFVVPIVGNQSMSENCLFLNIWTPTINASANLPVMVFINGGGFVVGAGSEASYNGVRFVSEYKNVVYVSINYRLGIFLR